MAIKHDDTFNPEALPARSTLAAKIATEIFALDWVVDVHGTLDERYARFDKVQEIIDRLVSEEAKG